MRWNSEVKHAELTPARTWSKKDEGNFGGRSLLTPDPDALAHYGVPGMRWGIKTKEYVKKGYDTLKRRQAILKMKRKAEAKAQYDEGFHRGQRVAANLNFIKNRVDKGLAKKEAQNKQSFSDRAVDKGTDFLLKKSGLDKTIKDYGLDALLPKAKSFLKDQKDKGIDQIYDMLQDEENQRKLQEALNYVLTGRVTQAGVRVVQTAGRAVRSAVQRNAPSIGRAIGRGAVAAGKAAGRAAISGARAGSKWLREGGSEKIRSAANTAGNALLKGAYYTADQLNRSANYAHRHAGRGHQALNRMLSRRPRRS